MWGGVELMPQYQDLSLQPPLRLEAVAQYSDEQAADLIMQR